MRPKSRSRNIMAKNCHSSPKKSARTTLYLIGGFFAYINRALQRSPRGRARRAPLLTRRKIQNCGPDRARTDHLRYAIATLYQMSYGPSWFLTFRIGHISLIGHICLIYLCILFFCGKDFPEIRLLSQILLLVPAKAGPIDTPL